MSKQQSICRFSCRKARLGSFLKMKPETPFLKNPLASRLNSRHWQSCKPMSITKFALSGTTPKARTFVNGLKMKNNNMIAINNLTKIFRTEEVETAALNGINLTINEGDFLSIMGPSGC